MFRRRLAGQGYRPAQKIIGQPADLVSTAACIPCVGQLTAIFLPSRHHDGKNPHS